MRKCWGGLNSSNAPSSTRPGKVRQVNGVELGITVNVGITQGVGEATGGRGVNVVIGGLAGEQAVMITRSVSSVDISFVA
jgi:hypothetical protein